LNNLDELASFSTLDSQNMLAQIDSLPDQLQAGWEQAQGLSLPAWPDIRHVLIAGMGGAAVSAELLAAATAHQCRAPIFIHRNYGLPAWASGPHTLFIAVSQSGNTEETLSAFEQANRDNCRCLAVSTGGRLAEAAAAVQAPLWTFPHPSLSHAAVGYMFGFLLAALERLSILPDQGEELAKAVEAMRSQQAFLQAKVPAVQNQAKRMAGQMMGRWVTVVGSGVLEPVARRWKGQINELAKAWAQFDVLPEADHNTLVGTQNPEELLSRTMVLFLRAASNHPRNRIRSELTRQTFMLEGLPTDYVDAQGNTPLAQMWTALHYGDYTAYYLAIAYGIDPTPVPAIQNLKADLQAIRNE